MVYKWGRLIQAYLVGPKTIAREVFQLKCNLDIVLHIWLGIGCICILVSIGIEQGGKIQPVGILFCTACMPSKLLHDLVWRVLFFLQTRGIEQKGWTSLSVFVVQCLKIFVCLTYFFGIRDCQACNMTNNLFCIRPYYLIVGRKLNSNAKLWLISEIFPTRLINVKRFSPSVWSPFKILVQSARMICGSNNTHFHNTCLILFSSPAQPPQYHFLHLILGSSCFHFL